MATSNDSSAVPGAAPCAPPSSASSSSPSLLDTVTNTVAATIAAHPSAAVNAEMHADAHEAPTSDTLAGDKLNHDTLAHETVSPASAHPAPSSPASVAVVLVSSGDLDLLDRSLDALARQDLACAWEVLIVDDEPSPGTARMVAQWVTRTAPRDGGGASTSPRSRHGPQLRYLEHHGPRHGPSPGAARNLGWQAADAAVIAFTDEACVPATDWLRRGLAAFSSSSSSLSSASASAAAGVDAVCGRVDATLPRQATEFHLREHLRASAELNSCNWFCRRSVLERLGGFDERFMDAAAMDADMHFRLLEARLVMVRAPASAVSHPLTAAGWADSLTRLRFLDGDALLYKKHPRRYVDSRRRPPDWHDLAVVAALLMTAAGIRLHHEVWAVSAGGTWLVLTAMLCIRRLRDTAKTPSHIAAVLLTSPFVPPVALFWRLVGAVRHRIMYA